MVHSTSLIHHNNNRFLFSFHSKASSYSHSHSLSLSFSKSLSPPSSPSPSLLSSPSLCCRVSRVSTEALELSPPAPGFNFHREIARLGSLRDKLAACKTLEEKLGVIDADSRVRQVFGSRHRNAGFFSRVWASLELDSEDLFLLKCLVAAGQEHVLCLGFEPGETGLESTASSMKSALCALAEMIENLDSYNGNGSAGFGKKKKKKKKKKMGMMALEDEEIRDLTKLLETLGEIERFYDCVGGIIGSVSVVHLLVPTMFQGEVIYCLA